MKKILTFLMMFAMTAGILSAQPNADQPGPTLSYQVVVRDANNNLVVDSNVVAYVTITSSNDHFYNERIEGRTNHNGMLSLTIGLPQELELEEGQEPANADFPVNPVNPFASIDWSNAQIEVSIKAGENEIMSYTEDVFAVPYALNAGFLLTTPQIVAYLSEEETGADDVQAIWAALKDNQNGMLDAIRDEVVDYVKSHFDIAKQIARHYMHQVTGADVREAYDSVKALDPSVKQAIVNNVKRYLQNHRDLAMELAKYYISTASDEEIQTLYNKLTANEEVSDFIQGKVDTVLTDYLKTIGYDPACLTNNHFNNLCDLRAAARSMNNNPNDTCPRIVSVANTANDGLMALAINGGVIMTAYVKNYDPNKVTAYGFSLGNETAVRPARYVELTNDFGKFVDTLNETQYCRETLSATAKLTTTTCAVEGMTIDVQKSMTYTVPGYTFTIVKEGNTLKAVFDPTEAQQFFSSQRPNNIQWFVNEANTPAATGMTFDLPTNVNITTVRAHAFLRNCTYDVEYSNN